MSSPYLKSGEFIILTTDRVCINSVLYEVLLTTRHLILVDIRYAHFQPQTIPLSTILSVKGGKITTGELVITLSFSVTSSTGDSEPMVLIFSQQPGEQRKRERDEWLKKLMGLIVSVRQETINTGLPPADEERGIRPSIRRSVAPEKLPPYTTAVDTHPVPVELTIIPDEPESLAVPEEEQELPGMAFLEEDTKSEVTPGTFECEETPLPSGAEAGSKDTISPPEVREIVDSTPVPKDEAELQDMEPIGIPAAREIPGAAEADSPAQKPFTLSLREAVKSLIFPKEKRELPDTGTSSLPCIEETETAQQEEPGSPDMPTPPEPVVVESPTVSREDSELSGVITPEAGDITESGQQPVGEATPQIPKSPLPSDGTGSQRQTLFAVTAIILVILGIVGGAIFYPLYFATPPAKEPVPIPTPTLQQTPVQQTPVPTQVVIPPAGVWVRVVYPGNYYGWLGNPGSLQGVTGSGDQIYKIRESDGIVHVQIHKDDYSGNTLTVEIYRNGELINRRTRSTPMSSIELLIDAKTGNPPGVTSVVTHETNQTGSNGDRVMYF
jgi:hypothetical protein